MLKDVLREFHEARLSGAHVKAKKAVNRLQTKYSFKEEELITALVCEGFAEKECKAYLEKIKEVQVD